MPFLANADVTNWIAPIAQFGVGGAVLIWFMFRCEPRLTDIARSLDRMSRTILLWIVTTGAPANKDQAKGIIEEIDDAETKRK